MVGSGRAGMVVAHNKRSLPSTSPSSSTRRRHPRRCRIRRTYLAVVAAVSVVGLAASFVRTMLWMHRLHTHDGGGYDRADLNVAAVTAAADGAMSLATGLRAAGLIEHEEAAAAAKTSTPRLQRPMLRSAPEAKQSSHTRIEVETKKNTGSRNEGGYGNGDGGDDATLSTREWSRPIVHVVNTRFMQHQGNLVELAKARLVLFETICLPSLVNQSVLRRNVDVAGAGSDTEEEEEEAEGKEAGRMEEEEREEQYDDYDDPPFLWIIKIDPNLDPSVRSDLVSLLEPHQNFYLVGSNVNYGIGIKSGGWRGGEAGADVLASPIYVGDVDALKRAHSVREKRIVLETRVDADDGLNADYLEAVQADALETLRSSPSSTEMAAVPNDESNEDKARWKYWCVLHHLEWNPTPSLSLSSGQSEEGQGRGDAPSGRFLVRYSPQFCITPGLTVGAAIGLTESSIPRMVHTDVVVNIRHGKDGTCGLRKGSDCVRLVSNPTLGALRSRTPTSAGMHGVTPMDESKKPELVRKFEAKFRDPVERAKLWSLLGDQFGVSKPSMEDAASYVVEHLSALVLDNLRGQCTRGHSCKVASKEVLQRMLDVASGGAVDGVETVPVGA